MGEGGRHLHQAGEARALVALAVPVPVAVAVAVAVAVPWAVPPYDGPGRQQLLL